MEPAAAAAAEVKEPTTAAMDQVESPTTVQQKATAAAATAAAPPTPSARHAERSMRASTRHSSLATTAVQEQNKKLHEIIRQEKQQIVRKPKPQRRVKAAVAVSSSPDDHDSSDSAWSPPEIKVRRPKVKPEPSKEEDTLPTSLPDLSTFPPPIQLQPVVAAEFALGSASLPPPPLLPPLPLSMIAQLQEAFNITARQQGLLPPLQPMAVDQVTTAATAAAATDVGNKNYPGPIKRKSAAAKKQSGGGKKGRATKTKRKIQSTTPANKRSRLKKPAAPVAAAAAASSTLPPIPLELLQPPLQRPFLTPAQLLHASTALSLLASSNRFDPPNSPSMHPWQMPMRSVSPLPSHELQPMPFPPLPTSEDAAAYLASSPPPEDFGTEEETSLRSTSALSPLSTAATPLSVPSELADAESLSPRSVANAMLLSSPSLIPFSYGAEPDGSSPSPLRLAAQTIEAPVAPSPYPTDSMRSAPSFIPPIDPSKIRFGPLDSEVYRQRVKHNAAIAQRTAAEFEDEQ